MPSSRKLPANTTPDRHRRLIATTALLIIAVLLPGYLACSQRVALSKRSIITNVPGRRSLAVMHRSQDVAVCEFGASDQMGVTLDHLSREVEWTMQCAADAPERLSTMVENPEAFFVGVRSYVPDFSEQGVSTMLAGMGDILVRKPATDDGNATTLAMIHPEMTSDGGMLLTFTSKVIENFYGLGEQFDQPGEVNGDLGGRMRTPGCEFGNMLVEFHGGYVGNAQFPILYCVGDDNQQFAIFVDDTSPHTWDFTKADAPDANGQRTWTLTVPPRTTPLRWFVIGGDDLPSLREQYMDLVGKPPVPPKEMFGLWLSEYGFNDWNELDDKLRTLREHHFPIDGFVLDLQWFGDIQDDYKGKQMGSLTWDEDKFPQPAKKIATLREDEGVGIMVIEESYVDHRLPEYQTMSSKGYLVRDASGEKPARIDSWWGDGGMIDWTNTAGADYWHDTKCEPLIDAGVMGHWTDLGEPEAYRKDFWYMNTAVPGSHKHADAHNLFNFRWLESIERGYQRNGHERPPFIMSRSGTSGIQRFGASMWSGDIGSNLPSLAAHLNVQMHMSMSGIDYFGSDVGGFRRDSLMGDDEDEMYTRWFAHSCLLDVPLRPHTSNTENKYQTAPDRVGDLKSNLFNLRRRYALTPYLYSLAYAAHLVGEPVFPPLVYYYQNDDRVREIADQKMIGRDLMMATDVKAGDRRKRVYLPAGDWYDFETGKLYKGDVGRDVTIDPSRPDGVFTPPLFARAGAIIPMMHVDEKTMNVMGKRTDGSYDNGLIIHVFADSKQSVLQIDDDERPNSLTKSTREILISHKPVPAEMGEPLYPKSNAPTPKYEVSIAPLQPVESIRRNELPRNFQVRLHMGEHMRPIHRVWIIRQVSPQGIASGDLSTHNVYTRFKTLEKTDELNNAIDAAGWKLLNPGVIDLSSGNIPIFLGVRFLIEFNTHGSEESSPATPSDS